MSVFVTVGSTCFDELILAVCEPEVLQLFANEGFKKVIFQIGSGIVVPEESPIIEIELYRYKDRILDNIEGSSLIIGHAGAGTIIQTLIAHRPLVAVINENLMDNHQNELAEQYEKEGHLLFCTCSKLLETLKLYFQSKKLKPFISETGKFRGFLEEFMGFR